MKFEFRIREGYCGVVLAPETEAERDILLRLREPLKYQDTIVEWEGSGCYGYSNDRLKQVSIIFRTPKDEVEAP